MPLIVMVTVLLAALMHASWNFLVKRSENHDLSISGVVIGHLPFSLAAILISPRIDDGAWPFVLASAILHTLYQLFLLAAYRLGDLSQVYPLARGVAPLLVTFVSTLFLGMGLAGWEQFGVLIIGTGIMSLSLIRTESGEHNLPAVGAALITGVFIAAYSLVDGLGARKAGTALGFYGWLSTLNAFLFALFMRFRRPGVVTGALGRNWRFTLFGGGVSFAGFGMITWAFTQAPIPMVAALRETSIIFALLLGVLVLKERLSVLKIAATIATLAGVGLLRLGG